MSDLSRSLGRDRPGDGKPLACRFEQGILTEASTGRRAIPARQSRAASRYTTASSAAALDHLGAMHKAGSGAKTARQHEDGGRFSARLRRLEHFVNGLNR